MALPNRENIYKREVDPSHDDKFIWCDDNIILHRDN